MKEDDSENTPTSIQKMQQSRNESESLTTVEILENLQESLPLMSEEQINFNLLEIKQDNDQSSLASITNPVILQILFQWSIKTRFYLKNRYLLENIINGTSKSSENLKKKIQNFTEKYDVIYVNGIAASEDDKDENIIKRGIQKEKRAKFIASREQFLSNLYNLSQKLKQKQKIFEDNNDLLQYFRAQLNKINNFQVHITISPKKQKLLQNVSISSSSSVQQVEQISNDSEDMTQNKVSKHIFSIFFNDHLHKVKKINLENSFYVRTKNRYPLILDFNFAKFLYKNDDQLAHQVIAMDMIRYINHLLSGLTEKKQIVEYQIIPESCGAFYEFIENSMTIGNIKQKYQNGLPDYLNYLQEQQQQSSTIKMSSIRKRFAQTFAGFSIIQYLLDLKDRNNENIMVKSDGSILHIDLAFIFNASPGGISFENAPFKFPHQYLEAMGGFDSDIFKYYESLMVSNMTKLFINKEEIFTKLSYFIERRDDILCFKKFKLENMKSKLPKKLKQVRRHVEQLIGNSYDNWRTKKYDEYQFKTNKILV